MSKAPQTPARAIVLRFGGTRPLARALGLPPTTVSYWVKTGLVPTRHIATMIALARRTGVRLKVGDFIPKIPRRP